MKKTLFTLGLFLCPALLYPEVKMKDVLFQSGIQQTSLLEVFSSEGCSSCPPAEIWLNKLLHSPALWRDVVPVCLHVEYWDYLGWTDILGSDDNTRRQQWYQREGQMSSLYTPGFVLNGFEWKGWFNGKDLPKPPAKKAGVLTVKQLTPTNYLIEFVPAEAVSLWEAQIAVLGMEISSMVKAGENEGKTLEHNFSLLNLQKTHLVKNGTGYAAKVQINRENNFTKTTALAVWVLKADGTVPIQAVGGILP